MSRPVRHLVLPDTQCRPGRSIKHLVAAGRYIAEKTPDVVVHLGDHWDLPSLSSYDKGKKSAEGRRLHHDIEAGNLALAALTKEIRARRGYKPRLVLLRGNHCDRLRRAIEDDAKFDGAIGFHLFRDKELGWEVHDFLKVVKIGGISYCHYFYAPQTGRAYGGDARFKLTKIHQSFTQGHQQGLSSAIMEMPGGRRIRGLQAGSFYVGDESYAGPQGNHHWRGILVKNEVRDGDYDLMEVSIGYLLRRYS